MQQRDLARSSRPRPRRRPISPTSPLVGRQLWRVGDWGGASEQIGRRWEVLGAQALEDLIGVPRPAADSASYVPRAAVILAIEPELAAQVHSGGKPHADAILVGESNHRLVFEPVDFKWTLETADPKQVGADVLEALLSDPPPLLATRLDVAVAALSASGPPAYFDGIFLAPDHAENRAILAPRGPLDPTWVHLCSVDAVEFFQPLVGWNLANALAQTDGVRLRTVETSERYYRIAAGVLGALRKLSAGVFDLEAPDLDGPAEVANLRRERRLNTLAQLVSYLDRALTARGELVERLREIERASYPFGRFRKDLESRGLALPPTGRDRRFGRVYGAVMKVVGEHLRAEGRDLVAAGQSEPQALTTLDAAQLRWTTLARRTLDRVLSAEC